MKHVLVIDDLRVFIWPDDPEVNVVYARTLYEGNCRLHEQAWDEVWFDHDLGVDEDGNEIDIMPLVNQLDEEACLGAPVAIGQVLICTDNGVGRENIRRALERHYPVSPRQDPWRISGNP